MKLVVLGAGSISQRHVRNLYGLGHEVVAVFDPDQNRLTQISNLAPGAFLSCDEERVLSCEADAVLVCSPTVFHVSQARKAVQRNFHVFLEKPISNTLDGIDELIAEASAAQRLVLVGCNLRFSSSLGLTKQLLDNGKISSPISVRAHCGYYLPHWRPNTDYREGYGARKDAGGGIILDAFHEFEYLRWLFGEVCEVFCYAGKQSELEIDVEDTADILLRFVSGLTANLHLDYLQPTYRRACEIVAENGLVVWDYISGEVSLFNTADRHVEVFLRNINLELNQMFIDEMKHFVSCLEGRETPMLDARGGRAVLQIALAAKQSAATGEVVTIQQ
jgi:predicted dehydrogenase